MNLANSSRTRRIRDGRQAAILGEILGSPLHKEKDGLKLADIMQVSEDFLQALKEDLSAHEQKRESRSAYPLAGYENGDTSKPVGMSKGALDSPIELSMNRAGQALQFLAAYYVKVPNEKKYEVAQTASRVLKIFENTLWLREPQLQHPGRMASGPAGPLFLLGLMMCERQGVVDSPGWNDPAVNPYFKAEHFRRGHGEKDAILLRLHNKLTFANLEGPKGVAGYMPGHTYPTLIQEKQNHVFFGQKYARQGINITFIALAVISLYRKMYNYDPGLVAGKPDHLVEDSKKMMRLVVKDFGTLYDVNGNVVDPYRQSAHGNRLSLAIGHYDSPRGAFPSIGYNGLVGLAMMIQVMAETATPKQSTFLMMNSSPVLNHSLRYDAMTILNYYKGDIQRSGRLYELGAHNNMGYSALRAAEPRAEFIYNNWKYGNNPDTGKSYGYKEDFGGKRYWSQLTAAQKKQFMDAEGFTENQKNRTDSTFYNLANEGSDTAFPGAAGFAYSLAWVMPTHSLFSEHLPTYYGPSSTPARNYWEIDYSKPHANRSLMQAFAGTGEAAHARVLSGLAANLITHQTTVQ